MDEKSRNDGSVAVGVVAVRSGDLTVTGGDDPGGEVAYHQPGRPGPGRRVAPLDRLPVPAMTTRSCD